MAGSRDWPFEDEPGEEPDCSGSSSTRGFRPRRSCRSALPESRRLLDAERLRRSCELEVLSGDWASVLATLFGEDQKRCADGTTTAASRLATRVFLTPASQRGRG
jgi:hypothetical protein